MNNKSMMSDREAEIRRRLLQKSAICEELNRKVSSLSDALSEAYSERDSLISIVYNQQDKIRRMEDVIDLLLKDANKSTTTVEHPIRVVDKPDMHLFIYSV